MEKESHLLEELEKLSLTGSQGSSRKPRTSRSFPSLLDIPVDGYDPEPRDLRPPSARTMPPNWLLAHSSDSHSPLRTDINTIRSVHVGEHSPRSALDSERGRTLFRNSRAPNRKEQKFTLQSVNRRSRPPLSQVFGTDPDRRANGVENGLDGPDPEEEEELQLRTVSISKTKQSLGKHKQQLSVCSTSFPAFYERYVYLVATLETFNVESERCSRVL